MTIITLLKGSLYALQTIRKGMWPRKNVPLILKRSLNKMLKDKTQSNPGSKIKTRKSTSADLALLCRPLHNAFLYGTLADESIDSDLLCLSEAMSTIHCLLVDCRIPIAVVEYHLQGVPIKTML